MGLLDKLWDETLAGPTPDSGLGKLRKYNSFSARSASAPPPDLVPPPPINKVSPSIPVPRSDIANYRNLTVSVDSPPLPSSPSCSATPTSPFTPNTPGGSFKKLTRRKSATAALPNSVAKSPTGYDWIVLSALDR
ncbi:dormancy-associated protein homolog 4-like isoform X2 [Salvia miltiorrhiza]|uniref:dormancy-associated protein homolog 4-like isoform X2 n=1 Tax=Salvia miltiorrhiza TaxID=226208 RepID=UPI0025AB642D|nr:dormancy-associated protein homolog 4-like isoform X2 [Salvia miltiorrhiza]